jgi:uncharacterized membrane protein
MFVWSGQMVSQNPSSKIGSCIVAFCLLPMDGRCQQGTKESAMAPNSSADESFEQYSEKYHKPHTVDELTERNVQTIIQLEEAAKANRNAADRVADFIAGFCGSANFVWAHLIWFAVWIVLNLGGPAAFDPFPFQFLTLVVSLEAIFLSTFILMSQNHQTMLSERRNHLDLQINLLTEQENTKMLKILERIAEKVGAPLEDEPSLQVLEQATRPEKLVNQIERATKKDSE